MNAVPLLAVPDSGWVYVTRQVLTPAGPRVAILQEPAPEPVPLWVQVATGESAYGEGFLGIVLMVVALWGRIRSMLSRD